MDKMETRCNLMGYNKSTTLFLWYSCQKKYKMNLECNPWELSDKAKLRDILLLL